MSETRQFILFIVLGLIFGTVFSDARNGRQTNAAIQLLSSKIEGK